jgi:hypothetical protein
MIGIDELLARHRAEGIEDARVTDSPALELTLDHPVAFDGEVCHGQDHGPSSGRGDNP